VNLHYWAAKVHTPLWKNCVDYAFEAICRKHISQIKQSLFDSYYSYKPEILFAS
jgi:hypothetical protein